VLVQRMGHYRKAFGPPKALATGFCLMLGTDFIITYNCRSLAKTLTYRQGTRKCRYDLDIEMASLNRDGSILLY
jgi:hypothetical protein